MKPGCCWRAWAGCSRITAPRHVADRAEAGTFPDALWRAVSETGVPLAALPESAGGADAEWSDLFAVLRVAGRFAAPIPLAETMLAAWVASSAGLEVSEQPMTVGPVRADDRLTLERDGNGWRLSGRASRLPWAAQAGRIVLLADGPDGEMAVALDGAAGAEVAPGRNMAGEPRDTLTFRRVARGRRCSGAGRAGHRSGGGVPARRTGARGADGGRDWSAHWIPR